jgi:uncharacterized protein
VHQDGLVHISELSDRFVKDPHSVVKVGDKLTVRVLAVDLDRKRISLSAKAKAAAPRGAGPRPGEEARPPAGHAGKGAPPRGNAPRKDAPGRPKATFQNNPFADLLKKA